MAHRCPVLQGYVYPTGYPTFPLDKPSSPRDFDQSPGHVSTLSSYAIERYPTGYGFPVPFGCRPSLLGRPIPARASAQPWGKPTAEGSPYRGFHVPHRQAASGESASLRRERGTVSAGPLIPADLGSSKDVSATCVPFCITTLPPRLHVRSTRSQLFLA